MKETFKNIISFGGHNKIKEAEKSFLKIYSEYKVLHKNYVSKEKNIQKTFLNLKEAKKQALIKVRKISKVSNLLSIKDRKLIEESLEKEEYNLQKIETSISLGEQALNIGKGSLVGIASGSGVAGTAWALAGTYGIASTGTAISSLSGIAATNASLAMFGGGSLATGGFGIVGGQIMLGGLVAVPAIIITGLYQRWQANRKVIEIKEHGIKIVKQIDDLKKNIEIINALELRIEEVIYTLNKSLEAFDFTFEKTYNSIYKFGYISKIWKRVKQWFGKKPFNEYDLEQIKYLGLTTGKILKIIDTKII